MSQAPASTKLHRPATMLHRGRHHQTVRCRPASHIPVQGSSTDPTPASISRHSKFGLAAGSGSDDEPGGAVHPELDGV
eukprot:7381063-Prymnesium_polylepis.1